MIIAGVGLIVGSLSMTGVSLSLAGELVGLVDGSVALILVAGALTSFVLGLGMTVSAVYVLLAIVMAPALVAVGIDPIAAHLFVIYWATVSFITPPVALASFAAAGVAGTKSIPVSLTSMRLGVVMYIVPFCFALNPALVGQGPLGEVMIGLIFGVIGVIVMACCLEGYAIGLGRRISPILRVAGLVSGFLILMPELTTSLIGFAVTLIIGVTAYFTNPALTEEKSSVEDKH